MPNAFPRHAPQRLRFGEREIVKMSKKLLAGAAAAAALAFVVAACGQGVAERAGEDADSAYENATQGGENITDGPMENAGEAVDSAAKSATDAGEANTTP
jgi:hypothetical protein